MIFLFDFGARLFSKDRSYAPALLITMKVRNSRKKIWENPSLEKVVE